jgi:hypothetical protein
VKPVAEHHLAVAAARPASPAAESRRISEVEPEEVRFLWDPYVPLRKVTLLEGDPGQGKSWIAAALAASGSLGTGLPGAGPFEPFSTLFFTAEDGIADTLRPRLDRMAADGSRIFAHDAPLCPVSTTLVQRRQLHLCIVPGSAGRSPAASFCF